MAADVYCHIGSFKSYVKIFIDCFQLNLIDTRSHDIDVVCLKYSGHSTRTVDIKSN